MHELSKWDVATVWKQLDWTSGRLMLKKRKSEPLELENAPPVPGLYRITWDSVNDWMSLPAEISVMASRKIADPRLDIHELRPPVILTIGRTTHIYSRIRQHLGTNEKSNRLFMRL